MSTTTHDLPGRTIPPTGGLPPEETLPLDSDWSEVFDGAALTALIGKLVPWLPSRRWFRGKARVIESVRLREQISVPVEEQRAFLILFEVNYSEGEPELYVLPLACAFDDEAARIAREHPQLILAHISLKRPARKGVVYDAIVCKSFCHALLVLVARRQTMVGQSGGVESEPTAVLRRVRREKGLDIEPKVSKAEQSNSSVIYDGSLILKFFRRLDAGVNPELEIERFLSARKFPYSPPLAGALEYHANDGTVSTMAVLTSFVPGCHDAWEDTLTALHAFYGRVQDLPPQQRNAPLAPEAEDGVLGGMPPPPLARNLIGQYLEDASTLGQRTAALHLTLASDAADSAFQPEPWTMADQHSLFESLRRMTAQNFELLRQRLNTLDPATQIKAEKVLSLEEPIIQRFERIRQQPFNSVRIRTHGDYHLGQVLHHGNDFLIIDFEGEPAIALNERRKKQSALRDVAGMIYSFFYAAHSALREWPSTETDIISSENQRAWARYWSVWTGMNYLRVYRETARSSTIIPSDEKVMKTWLDVELLRKAIYELGYELNNRPGWVNIAFQVLLDLLNPENPI